MEKGRDDPLFDPYYWNKIVKTFVINGLTVPTLVILLFWVGIMDKPFVEVVKEFRNSYPLFFAPLNRLFEFFWENSLGAPILEELTYRGPIRIAIAFLLLVKRPTWLLISAIWIFGLFLNFQWATHHTANTLMWIPVFTAGIPLLWLVIRTNRLWPSIVCHATANLSIYFLVKVYQFLF